MKTFIQNISFCIIFGLLAGGTAEAHGINIFTRVETDSVYVVSQFSGGKKVKGGKIIVTDTQGVELVKGTTNTEGEFSFKIPQKTDLKIVLLTGTGHRAERVIPVSEIEMPAVGKNPISEIEIPAVGKNPIQRTGPGVKNIIFGIACIFGLVGIIWYFKNRKKKMNGSA